MHITYNTLALEFNGTNPQLSPWSLSLVIGKTGIIKPPLTELTGAIEVLIGLKYLARCLTYGKTLKTDHALLFWNPFQYF